MASDPGDRIHRLGIRAISGARDELFVSRRNDLRAPSAAGQSLSYQTRHLFHRNGDSVKQCA